MKSGTGRWRHVKVEIVLSKLESGRGLPTEASSRTVHILNNEVDMVLHTL